MEVDYNSLPFISETVHAIEDTKSSIQDLSIIKNINSFKNEYGPQI